MQQFPSVQDELEDYLDASFPIIYIYTFEETKADSCIASSVDNMPIVEWSGANGYVDYKSKTRIPEYTLEQTLSTLKGKAFDRHILIIKDAANELESPKIVAYLKEIARKICTNAIDSRVVIISSKLKIPQELEKFITIMELALPKEDVIKDIVKKHISEIGINIEINSEFLEEMSIAFKGLSEFEIKELLNLAIAKGENLTKNFLSLISDQKKQIILKSGILEMIDVKESINDIGGLENLKEWLNKKAKVFKRIKEAENFGVPTPKGVLIAGVAGCGKSLTAKAAGALFDVPLLRLDMGRLMGKYVGESEENMRKAIMLAEAISPCVLWVDELEKAFAGIGGGGSEVTTRLFGAFLTWMQEKDRINYERRCKRKFSDSEKGKYIYKVYPCDRSFASYYRGFKNALKYGEKSLDGQRFVIERLPLDITAEHAEAYCSRCVFDASGNILYFNAPFTFGYPPDKKRGAKERFEDIFIEFEYPFERGDIVRGYWHDEEFIGIAEDTSETYREHIAYCEKERFCALIYDNRTSIDVIQKDGSVYYAECYLITMEKVTERGDIPKKDWDMLCYMSRLLKGKERLWNFGYNLNNYMN